jgi:hypothetical protein
MKMNETPRKKVQYSHRLSKEKLREFLDSSPEAKLEWLEEANRFINEFLPSEKVSDGRVHKTEINDCCNY